MEKNNAIIDINPRNSIVRYYYFDILDIVSVLIYRRISSIFLLTISAVSGSICNRDLSQNKYLNLMREGS